MKVLALVLGPGLGMVSLVVLGLGLGMELTVLSSEEAVVVVEQLDGLQGLAEGFAGGGQ